MTLIRHDINIILFFDHYHPSIVRFNRKCNNIIMYVEDCFVGLCNTIIDSDSAYALLAMTIKSKDASSRRRSRQVARRKDRQVTSLRS